jgi:hypothetical protein
LKNFLLEKDINEILIDINDLICEINFIDNYIDDIDEDEFQEGILKIENKIK